ncbi:MAG: DNA N-6-adenine-methyltransferase [Candidatus Hadarchaeum sp.]
MRNIRSKGSRDEWRTPPEFFELINKEFNFTIDGAASRENSLLPRFYSKENSAFDASPSKETIFVNPPYSDIMPWVHLAYDWSVGGNTVVMLLPAATDTGWWAAASWMANEIRLMSPRVKFINSDGRPQGSPPFGSALVIFRPVTYVMCKYKQKHGGYKIVSTPWRVEHAYIYQWTWYITGFDYAEEPHSLDNEE